MKYIVCVLLLLGLVSCTVDYNPDEVLSTTQNQLIVNSYLSPQHKIEIRFYATSITNKVYSYTSESNITISLKENDSVLYNGICADSIFTLDYYPKAGHNYSISASANGLSSISAETNIPDSIVCSVKYDSTYSIINLQHFKLTTGTNSIWLTANYMDGDIVSDGFYEYITNSSLADNVNKANDTFSGNEMLGSSYCDGFIRVKAANVQQLDSLLFTDMKPFMTNFTNGKFSAIRVHLITASNEYDQYNRTYYQQVSIPAEDDINAMIYQPVHVYCNVKNGLGIFAGLNETYYYVHK